MSRIRAERSCRCGSVVEQWWKLRRAPVPGGLEVVMHLGWPMPTSGGVTGTIPQMDRPANPDLSEIASTLFDRKEGAFHPGSCGGSVELRLGDRGGGGARQAVIGGLVRVVTGS